MCSATWDGMHVDLALDALWTALLVLLRVTGLLVFVPLPGASSAPIITRIAFALLLTFALLPGAPAAQSVNTIGEIVTHVAAESAYGLGVGVCLSLLLETFAAAAQTAAMQAGFSYVSTIDPTSKADTGILVALSGMLAGLLFYALGLDQLLLRGLASSLQTQPPGTLPHMAQAGPALLSLMGRLFEIGLRLAVPIVLLLVLVDLTLAACCQVNAQLQLLSLAFPVKLLAALLGIASLLGAVPVLYRTAAEAAFSFLAVLGGAGR